MIVITLLFEMGSWHLYFDEFFLHKFFNGVMIELIFLCSFAFTIFVIFWVGLRIFYSVFHTSPIECEAFIYVLPSNLSEYLSIRVKKRRFTLRHLSLHRLLFKMPNGKFMLLKDVGQVWNFDGVYCTISYIDFRADIYLEDIMDCLETEGFLGKCEIEIIAVPNFGKECRTILELDLNQYEKT